MSRVARTERILGLANWVFPRLEHRYCGISQSISHLARMNMREPVHWMTCGTGLCLFGNGQEELFRLSVSFRQPSCGCSYLHRMRAEGFHRAIRQYMRCSSCSQMTTSSICCYVVSLILPLDSSELTWLDQRLILDYQQVKVQSSHPAWIRHFPAYIQSHTSFGTCN